MEGKTLEITDARKYRTEKWRVLKVVKTPVSELKAGHAFIDYKDGST